VSVPGSSRRAHALLVVGALLFRPVVGRAADTVERPFQGVTHVTRLESEPRSLRIHIVKIDLTAPGVRLKLTPPGGKRETVRQTTLEFLKQEHAQVGINAHFFLPFPSAETDVDLVGFAASEGKVFSGFEKPVQSYAIVADAPALHIDSANHATIVHRDPSFDDGLHILEKVNVWTAVSGSAQIVTGGKKTIPRYLDDFTIDGLLRPGGPNAYSNTKSWYDVPQARSAAALTADARTLILFTVDVRNGSAGMSVGEVADLLIREGARDALNLDGGGSTTLAMEDPATRTARIVNVSSDNPQGRSVGSNLVVFAVSPPARN
jgi:exopolysaccharide biosynthesis protein